MNMLCISVPEVRVIDKSPCGAGDNHKIIIKKKYTITIQCFFPSENLRY